MLWVPLSYWSRFSGKIFKFFTNQRSVGMDTKKMDTGVYVHVTDMYVDMDTKFLKNRDMDMDTR